MSTIRYGSPEIGAVAPVIAADWLYNAGIEIYVQRNFAGADGPLADQYARDVFAKTILATGIGFFVNSLFNGDVDILDTVTNSLITFAAGNGIKEALYLP